MRKDNIETVRVYRFTSKPFINVSKNPGNILFANKDNKILIPWINRQIVEYTVNDKVKCFLGRPGMTGLIDYFNPVFFEPEKEVAVTHPVYWGRPFGEGGKLTILDKKLLPTEELLQAVYSNDQEWTNYEPQKELIVRDYSPATVNSMNRGGVLEGYYQIENQYFAMGMSDRKNYLDRSNDVQRMSVPKHLTVLRDMLFSFYQAGRSAQSKIAEIKVPDNLEKTLFETR